MLINVGQWLRELTCQHHATATHTQAFSEPHPHVTSHTVCLDCGKAVSPRTPVSQDVLHKLLDDAASAASKTKNA